MLCIIQILNYPIFELITPRPKWSRLKLNKSINEFQPSICVSLIPVACFSNHNWPSLGFNVCSLSCTSFEILCAERKSCVVNKMQLAFWGRIHCPNLAVPKYSPIDWGPTIASSRTFFFIGGVKTFCISWRSSPRRHQRSRCAKLRRQAYRVNERFYAHQMFQCART